MVKLALVVALLGGCDLVFGLTQIPDAPPMPVDVSGPCPAISAGPDEDGDGCADLLDNCPGTPNPDQLDSDLDGVGDACDPHPQAMGDTIASAAFFDQDVDGGWTLDDQANWTVSGGQLTNLVGLASAQLSRPINATGFPTLEIGYTILQFTNMVSTLRVQLGAIICHIDRNDPDFDLFLTGAMGASAANDAPKQRLVFQLDPAGTTCSFGPGLNSATVFPGGPTIATIELDSVQIAISYIIVYGSS